MTKERVKRLFWFKFFAWLLGAPEIARLAECLGVNAREALGWFVSLVTWALPHTKNGDLSRFNDYQIAEGCRWSGNEAAFVKALRDSGLLTTKRRVLYWKEMVSRVRDRQDKMAVNSRNYRRRRAAEQDDDIIVTSSTEVGDDIIGASSTREEKMREESTSRGVGTNRDNSLAAQTSEVINHYLKEYKKQYEQVPPLTDGPKRSFRALVKDYGPEMTKKFIDLYLKDTDDFITGSGHAPGLLRSNVPKYIARLKRESVSRSSIPHKEPTKTRTPAEEERWQQELTKARAVVEGAAKAQTRDGPVPISEPLKVVASAMVKK